MQNFWKKLNQPFFVLAPMDDVTDVVFREMVTKHNKPDVLFTEFTSTDGLCSTGFETVSRRLMKTESQHPIVAQIWGNNPESYFKSAQIIQKMGFDGIDINMGCPDKDVIHKGQCSALIANPDLAKKLITATKKGASDIPVSVKTRIGLREVQTDEWITFLLKQNLAAVTVHGRTAKQMSKVPADWAEIKKAVELRDQISPATVIIGNGDVLSLEEGRARVKETGVDGIMIGRGIFHDPWIFHPNENVTLKNRLDLLLEHTKLFVQTWGNTKNFAIMKKFFKMYINGFDGASDIRIKLMECQNLSEVETVVKSL